MTGHAQLKFVMTECSKTQIRLKRLILFTVVRNTTSATGKYNCSSSVKVAIFTDFKLPRIKLRCPIKQMKCPRSPAETMHRLLVSIVGVEE